MVEATRASDEERATFGEVVKNLAGAGIERYHTDLLRGEKIDYLPDGESEVVKGNAVAAIPARNFSATGVDAAVRAIQAGQILVRDVLRADQRGWLRGLYGVIGRATRRLLRSDR